MTPVTQDKFGGEEGNCFAACIASLLDRPLEEVPNFCAHKGEDWYERFIDWLHANGWTAVCLRHPLGDAARHLLEGYYIASGPAERGLLHSVIGKGGLVAHDPHPSRAGLIGVEDYTWLIPLEPRS